MTDHERAYAEMIGEAVHEDLRKSLPLIRARVEAILRLDSMPRIAPGTGRVVADAYLDGVIRAVEELRS